VGEHAQADDVQVVVTLGAKPGIEIVQAGAPAIPATARLQHHDAGGEAAELDGVWVRQHCH
jgi:hypothetical protein